MPSVLRLLPKLQTAYPGINFAKGDMFVWSAKDRTITYTLDYDNQDHAVWALIHEVAHAELEHNYYKSDIDLLRHEVDAWHRAKDIAQSFHITIDEEHIQDCLDTYRDWLHKRATCPNCNVITMQQDDKTYRCFNCQTSWRVPASPQCRITRRKINE